MHVIQFMAGSNSFPVFALYALYAHSALLAIALSAHDPNAGRKRRASPPPRMAIAIFVIFCCVQTAMGYDISLRACVKSASVSDQDNVGTSDPYFEIVRAPLISPPPPFHPQT